jgi:hypothetical protein
MAVTTEPSPDQLVARRFWADFSHSTSFTLFVLGKLAEIGAGDYDDERDRREAYDGLLRRLSLPALEPLVAELEHARAETIGFWEGHYTLVGDDHTLYALDITGRGASVTLGHLTSDEATFSGGVLRVTGALGTLQLTFDAATGMDDLESAAKGTPPRCTGTLQLAARTVAVHGKQGCFSREGVARDEPGDPPAYWAGTYSLLYTDTFEWAGDNVTIKADNGKLLVGHGSLNGTDTEYLGNGSMLMLGGQQVAIKFEHTERRKTFYGLIKAGDKVRPMTAYATTAAATPATLRARRLGDTVSIPLDPLDKEVELPAVHVGIPYAVTMTLVLPETTTLVAPFTWSLVERPAALTLTPSADSKSATLAGTLTTAIDKLAMTVTDRAKPVARTISFELSAELEGVIVELGTGTTILPDANLDNDYSVLLSVKPTTADTDALAFEPVDPTADVWTNLSVRKVGDRSALLIGSFRGSIGKGHNTFQVKAGTVTYALALDVKELRPIEVHPEDLRPVTMRRRYDVRLAAIGGREPYTWKLLDSAGKDEHNTPYFATKGIAFKSDPVTGNVRITGETSDESVSNSTIGVRVRASSASSVVMEPTTVVYALEFREPEEQLKDVKAWVAFAVTLTAALLGLTAWLGKHIAEYVDKEKGKDKELPAGDAVTKVGEKLPDAAKVGELRGSDLSKILLKEWIYKTALDRAERAEDNVNRITDRIADFNRDIDRLQARWEALPDLIKQAKDAEKQRLVDEFERVGRELDAALFERRRLADRRTQAEDARNDRAKEAEHARDAHAL